MPASNRSQHGFTLVELSVVLAIVGLLAGGIVAGRYLIRQSELQSIVSDLAKYKSANIQFRDSYNGKPGDIRDAETNWGTDPNGCPTNTVRTPRRETCNGNGDRSIGANEQWRAWQQLAAAELIESMYSGVAGSGGSGHAVAGQNVPPGRLANSAYYLITMPAMSGNTDFYDLLVAADVIFVGAQTSSSAPTGGLLTPRQQLQLDNKLDDGKPATGVLMALKSTLNSGCTSSNTQSATYLLATTSNACSIAYQIEF